MFGQGFFDPRILTVRIPAFLLALTIHEFMHGWTANRLGDDTAKLMGRLTFNPIAHLDAWGVAFMMMVGFGWAKPVPVNIARLARPRRDILLVSLAGPLANLGLACFFGTALRIGCVFLEGKEDPISAGLGWIFSFACISVMINCILAAFNMLPIPPLDGSKLWASLLPSRGWEIRMARWEAHGPILLFVLLIWDRMGSMPGPLNWYLSGVLNLLVPIFSGMDSFQLWYRSMSMLGG